MGTMAAYVLVAGGDLMIVLGGWIWKQGKFPDRLFRENARLSVRDVSLLLCVTGVAANVSQLPVALGADPGTKLLLWFASLPFLVAALWLVLRIVSVCPDGDDAARRQRPHRPVDQ